MGEPPADESIHVPFASRGVVGSVAVTVEPNGNPRALGCHLLDATLPDDAARGYPVCRASIGIELDGYAAAFGWIQVVRSTDGEPPDEFDIDPLALFRDVSTPFAFFGIKPLLFDAPFREARDDLGWEAQAFLCEVPDGVMSKRVRPIAAFRWGFDVAAGVVTIHPPRALELRSWDDHLGLLRGTYPGWTFDAS